MAGEVQAPQGTATTAPQQVVDKNKNFFSSESFLKILAAELQNQDPLNPQSNSDYVAQMASFSNLDYQEQIATGVQNLTLTSSLSQGATLIGKDVKYTVDGAAPGSGRVERVTVADGAVALVIGGTTVSLDRVIEVS